MNSLLPFCKKNSGLFYCLCFLFLSCSFGWSQTNPTAQSLPYSQNFSSLNGSTTSYPAGWQGWQVGAAAPSSGGRTNAPTADKTMSGGTAASTGNGVYDYNGKLGFLSTGSVDNSVVLALNTTGYSGVVVTFDAMTIRNTYDGTTNITQGLVLQYRTDTSSAFTNIAYTTSTGTATEYQNNTTTQLTGTTGQNIVTGLKVSLPAVCDNKATVQLRWIYRNVGPGSTATSGRPTMAIDNVSVTLAPSVSIGALSGTFSDRCIGTTSTTGTARSFTISGSNLTSANVVISQPGFIFSLTSGSAYGSSLTLTPSSGSIASTTVFVRFSPTAVQNYTGVGAITGGGLASAASFTVSANGINTAVSSVATGAASNITGISATVASSYIVGCSTAIANGVEYSTTSGFANGTGTLVAGTAIGALFTTNLSGLLPSTTYYYRTVVTDNSGAGANGSPATYYGSTEGSFTTATPAITINTTTNGTYNGGAFADRCIGTSTSTGEARSFTISGTNLTTAPIVITLDGFIFSSSGNTGTYSSPLTINQTGGTYSNTIYVRFAPTSMQSYNGTFAITGGGLATGVNGVFPNVNGINLTATTSTVAASSITTTSATLNGTYATAACSGAITVNGFEYSTTNNFANGSGTFVTATGTTTFSSGSNLTGLTPDTTYYYKSKIIDATIGSNSVTVYGEQLSFTTASTASPVLTLSSLSGAFANRCIDTTSSSNTFTISGSDLTSDPITVGPLSGFAFSTNGTTFSSSLSLTQSGGTFGPATVYVQFTPTTAVTYDGNISVGGGGTTMLISLAVSASGLNTAASTTNGTATGITSTTANIAGSYNVGCSSVISSGIIYSSTNGFSNAVGTQVTGTAGLLFSASLNGLSPNTTYYYKSYVMDGTGTIYATTQSSFTTLSINSPVATVATNVTSSSFVANWGTVAGASNYLLDVLKSDKIAEWTFPVSGTTLTADNTSNASNTASALTLSSGTITSVSGASSFAASGSAWTTLGKNWEISVNTSGYYNLTVSSVQNSSASGPRDFKLQYKIGSSGTYTDVPGGSITVASDYITGLVSNLALPSACDNQSSVFIRWITTSTTNVGGTSVGSGGTNRIDNILVKGIIPLSGYNNLSAATNSSSVSGLSTSSDYFYRVRATSPASTSVNSNLVSVTTKADETVADYRSKNSGNFSDVSIWEYFDGTAWSTASQVPTSNNNILILSTHEVSLTADITVSSNKSLTVNGALNAAGNIVAGTGSFILTSGSTIKLGDNISLGTAITTTTKTFDAGANYIYNGSVAQTTASLPNTVTGNVTVSNAVGVTFTSNKFVNTPGTFTVTNNGNVIFGNGVNTVYYLGGTGNFSAGSGSTFVLTNSNGISNDGLSGNIRLTGTRAFASGINYNFTKNDANTFLPSNMGTSFGSEITSINNLIVNNPYNVIVPTNITVDGILTFTAGNIVTGVNTITIGSNGLVSRSYTGASSGYVVGNLKKNISTSTTSISYEIGDASNYRPIDLAFTGVTVAGTLTANVSQSAGSHPQLTNSSINPTKLVNRYYSLNGTSLSFTSCDATFNYVASDVLISASTSSFIVGQYNGASWNYPAVGTLTTTSSQAIGLTSFGDFVFGEAKPLITSATLSGDSTICSGNSTGFNVAVTGGTSPYTVVYNNGSSDITVTGYTSGSAISVSPTSNTVYTLVSVTDTYGYTSPSNSGSATVTVNLLTTSSQSATACDSYTWSANGTTYATSGTYTYTGLNAAGCTHTKTLVLTINNSTSESASATACNSYTWTAGTGTTYTASGTYTSTGPNAAGCTLTKTLVLTINNSTSSVETVTSSTCGTYTWSVNNQTYTSSGTYTVTGTNAAGCPDTKTLVLTINPCQSVVTVKMNIQGFTLPNGMMKPVLSNQGVGSSTTNVDNVTIELHNTTSPFATFATTTAMLQTNGDAVATFSSAPVGSFYIVVKHRNSLETWSANPVTIGASSTYDFTDSASKAYGDNMILVGGKYSIYNGDLNQDGFIEGTDYDSLNTDTSNSEVGFFATDLNGDGFVEGEDYDTININTSNSVIIARP